MMEQDIVKEIKDLKIDKDFIIKGTTATSKTHVVYTTFLGYVCTTIENYNNRISDDRKNINFYDSQNFKDISDVIDYIEKYF